MNCTGCGRENKPNRRFCGGCGLNLDPICKRCQFENDAPDRFCGGCGDRLGATIVAPAAAPSAPPPPRRTAQLSIVPAPVAVSFARGGADDSLSAGELAELLAPAEATGVVALPDGAIGQDDLDRLFGGGS